MHFFRNIYSSFFPLHFFFRCLKCSKKSSFGGFSLSFMIPETISVVNLLISTFSSKMFPFFGTKEGMCQEKTKESPQSAKIRRNCEPFSDQI